MIEQNSTKTFNLKPVLLKLKLSKKVLTFYLKLRISDVFQRLHRLKSNFPKTLHCTAKFCSEFEIGF